MSPVMSPVFTMDVPCPVCNSEAEALARYGVSLRKLVIYKIICNRCGLQWRFSNGDLYECAKKYIKNHPVESCLGAL